MIKIPEFSPIIAKILTDDNAVLYCRFLMKQMRKAIKNNAREITVYEVQNTGKRGSIPHTEFLTLITNCMQIFIDHEAYEYADEAKKLKNAMNKHFSKIEKQA